MSYSPRRGSRSGARALTPRGRDDSKAMEDFLKKNIRKIDTSIWNLYLNSHKERTMYSNDLKMLEHKIDESLKKIMDDNYNLNNLYSEIQFNQKIMDKKIDKIMAIQEGQKVEESEEEAELVPTRYEYYRGGQIRNFWEAFFRQNIVGMGYYYDPNVHKKLPNTQGETPLCFASHLGKLDIVTFLLEHGADINEPEDLFFHTPLMRASINGNDKVVLCLLKNGGDPNKQDRYLETALHQATRYNYSVIAKLLLDYGANLNLKNAAGQTPLEVGKAVSKPDNEIKLYPHLFYNYPDEKQIRKNTKELSSTVVRELPSTADRELPSTADRELPSTSASGSELPFISDKELSPTVDKDTSSNPDEECPSSPDKESKSISDDNETPMD